MGYNRAGARRKARLKRSRRHEERLLARAIEADKAQAKGTDVVTRVKGAARALASAVGETVQAVTSSLRGNKGK